MVRRILLVRHATADESPAPRYIGSTDLVLTDKGVRQADALRDALPKRRPQRCRCSPLHRATETARRAVEPLGLPVETEPRLREIDFGRWEGITFPQIREAEPEMVDQWAANRDDFCFPGGESISAFHGRIESVRQSLLGEGSERMLLVAHGGVIRALVCSLLGWPLRQRLAFRIDPASISAVDVLDGRGVLVELNNTSHLEGL